MERALALVVLLAGCAAAPAVSLRREIRSRALGERRFAHDALVTAVAFTPDGERLVTGDETGIVRVFDLDGHELEKHETQGEEIRTVGVLADGTLVSASSGCVRVGSQTYAAAAVPAVAIGERLVAFAHDARTVALVDSRVEVTRIDHRNTACTAFSEGDERLALVNRDAAEIRETRTGRVSSERFDPMLRTASIVPTEAAFLDGTRLLLGSCGESWVLRIGRLQDLERRDLAANRESYGFAVGRDGSRAFVTASADTEEIRYERGPLVWTAWVPVERRSAIAISPTAPRVAVASGAGVVLLDAHDGARVPRDQGFAAIERIAFTAHGVLAVTRDSLCREWSSSGTLLSARGSSSCFVALGGESWMGVPSSSIGGRVPRSCALSRDAKSIAVAAGDDFYLLDAATRAVRTKWILDATIEDLAFTDDGSLVLGVMRGGLVALEVETGEYHVLDERRPIGFASTRVGVRWVDSWRHVQPGDVPLDAWGTSAAFSPQGDLVALGGRTSIPVLDVRTGRLLASLAGHRAPVTALSFSMDGRTLASGDESGALRLWDLR